MEIIELLKTLDFSNFGWIIATPIIFSIADILTGLIQAIINDDVKSKKMREGLLHKTLIIIVLLQSGKADGGPQIISGGQSELFSNRKERGSELVITWLTFIFAIIFLFLAILVYALQPDAPAADTSTTALRLLTTIL